MEFATKAMLAQAHAGAALDAGVPASWVTADEAYGQDYKFRTWCERRRIGYVVAVPRSQTIPAGAGSAAPITPSPAHPSRRGSGAAAPTARKARACSTGPWPRCRRGAHPTGWSRWLLVRRQILTADQVEAGKEPELAYYLCAVSLSSQ